MTKRKLQKYITIWEAMNENLIKIIHSFNFISFLIIGILSVGFPKLLYFHLLTHALFKALLFIFIHFIAFTLRKNIELTNDPSGETLFFVSPIFEPDILNEYISR